MAVEVRKGSEAVVTLAGSRGIKDRAYTEIPYMREEALRLEAAHKIAAVALEGLDQRLSVLQLRPRKAFPKKGIGGRYAKRAEGKYVLGMKRLKPDALSEAFLQAYEKYWERLANKDFGDGEEREKVLRHAERFPKRLLKDIRSRLESAGLRPMNGKFDIAAHNFIVTQAGEKVLIEMLHPRKTAQFSPPDVEMLGVRKAERIRRIIAEFERKLAQEV